MDAASPTPSSMTCWKPEHFRRHCFLWVEEKEAVISTCESDPPGVDALDILGDWIAHGRPLIVRRPCVSENGKLVFVGLALPPTPFKRRLGFRLPLDAVRKVTAPPRWEMNWVSGRDEGLDAVVTAATAAGLTVQTFGSHAWQHHTGLAYATPSSDVDLLVAVTNRKNWRVFRDSLQERSFADERVDLEIVLNGDASFRWREYGAPAARMLFKGNCSVWLGDKTSVEDFLHE